MKTDVAMIESAQEKSVIARAILTGLPEWFGIEESREAYIGECEQLPFWAAYREGKPIGFIALKRTSEWVGEICVMGVSKAAHRSGAGRALFCALRDYAARQGMKCLQVKTVAEGRYPEYDATRRFYESMGFYELEVFPTLWDKENPCSVMILPLQC